MRRDSPRRSIKFSCSSHERFLARDRRVRITIRYIPRERPTRLLTANGCCLRTDEQYRIWFTDTDSNRPSVRSIRLYGEQLCDRPAGYWAARFNNARVTVDLARDNIRQSLSIAYASRTFGTLGVGEDLAAIPSASPLRDHSLNFARSIFLLSRKGLCPVSYKKLGPQ